MAEKAKEYQDLIKTTEIVDDALFAVAQPGQSELQSAQTATVARKIGSLLEDGAYAELTYATSQGKNLLAQNLQAKGVADASPSDTLVKLADDVNNLNVEMSLEDVWTGGIAKTPSHGTFTSVRSPFIYLHMDTAGTVAVLSGTTLHLIKQGPFKTFDEFIDGACAAVEIEEMDTSTSNNTAAMARTPDGSKILIRKNTTQYQVVNVDIAAGTLTLGAAYTSQTAAGGSYCGLAVSDDLKTVVIPTHTSGTNVADIVLWNPIDEKYSSAISIKAAAGQYYSNCVIADNFIYLWRSAQYENSGDTTLTRVGFELLEDGTPGVTSPCALVGFTTHTIDYCYEGRFFIGVPLKLTAITPSDTVMCATATIQIWDIDNPAQEVVKKEINTMNALNPAASFNVIEGQARLPLKSRESGVFEFILPTGTSNAVYNKNTHQFDPGEITVTSVAYSQSSSQASINMCIALSDDGKNILSTAESAYTANRLGRSIYNSGYNILSCVKGTYLLGRKRTVNGYTVYYRLYSATAEHASDGYYDQHTQVAPAVPDAAQLPVTSYAFHVEQRIPLTNNSNGYVYMASDHPQTGDPVYYDEALSIPLATVLEPAPVYPGYGWMIQGEGYPTAYPGLPAVAVTLVSEETYPRIATYAMEVTGTLYYTEVNPSSGSEVYTSKADCIAHTNAAGTVVTAREDNEAGTATYELITELVCEEDDLIHGLLNAYNLILKEITRYKPDENSSND